MKTGPHEETQRLARLYEYEILDTTPERAFERITRVAARLFAVPIAAITFIDADREWLKAEYGLPKREYPLEESFCLCTIETDTVLVVPDATADPRFAGYAVVGGELGIRFYAGAPLRTADGYRLGAMCVSDRVPREFSAEDEALLADLAAVVVDELDLRHLARKLKAEVARGLEAQAALQRRQARLQRLRGALEGRVERRTIELMRANASLRAEITRRKKGEAALQHAKKEAEKANRAKSEFLSRMSHELRTPLNAILGFGQILQAQVPSDAHRDCTTHIVNAGRHLLGLINEVLDISRIEAGRVELTLEPLRMAEIVGETLDLIRPLAEQYGVTVELAAKACVSEIVLADRQRFKQVLLNLLSNAVKYSSPGASVTLNCQKARARMVRLCVQDTGPGIAPEALERLFVPFDRLGADQTGVPGTGLGLTLSKHLAEAMNGTLGVTSAPGEGSTFWVELPRADSSQALPPLRGLRVPDHLRPGNADGQSLGNGYTYSNGNGHRYAVSDHHGDAPDAPFAADAARTLLYIEDNASNVSLVEHLLEGRPGIRLLTSARGEEGLQLARTHLPDLILLDLHLPDLDGWEVLSRLRRLRATRGISVVAISADATRDNIDRLLRAGVRAYLTKPLNVDHFLHLLNTLRFPPSLTALHAAGAV